jgi:Fur family zinc uptake transcriptional regulator
MMEQLLEHAAARCAAGGVRLTPLRRQILRLLLEAETPVAAYSLLERLRAAVHRAVAPPTIYRALDFLLEQGLAHRIERLNAFVACSCMASGAAGHAHQFLLCRGCGAAAQLQDAAVTHAVAEAAAQAGFLATGPATIELEGLCPRCAAQAETATEPGCRPTALPRASPRHRRKTRDISTGTLLTAAASSNPLHLEDDRLLALGHRDVPAEPNHATKLGLLIDGGPGGS